MYIKFSGIPVKSQTVWQNSEKYISVDQIYFYWIFFEKKSLAEVLLTHAEETWLCRISSFYEKERLSNSSKTFVNQWEPMGFCKLQKKKTCEEISTTRLRHVDYLHSSSIYPQEGENNTEEGRKSKVKIIATIASQS